MKSLTHAVIAALAVILGEIPAIIASPAITNFVETHPAYAVYVPLVTGLAAAGLSMLHDRSKLPS